MDEENSPKPKYYKMRLDPNYRVGMVNEKTHKLWEKASKKKLDDLTGTGSKMQIGADDEPQCSLQKSEENLESMQFAEYQEYIPQVEEYVDEEYEIDSESSDYDEDVNILEENLQVKNKSFPCESTTEENFEKTFIEGKSSNSFTSWSINDGEKIMFEESGMSVNDVIEMVVAYGIRFGISQQAREWLIELLKICAGPRFKDFIVSNYKLSQAFDPPSDKISYHFYCDKCKKKEKLLHSSFKEGIKSQRKVCDKCEIEHTISLGNPNFFVIVDLKYQLEILLQNEEVAHSILSKIISNTKDQLNNDIRDVEDSKLFKKTSQLNPKMLTYNLSTDGAPLFHITKRGFWPLQLVLNFLPLNLRFKYVFLGGIMVVRSEPKPDLMNLFIKEFTTQVTCLYSEGIRLNLPNHDGEVILKFAPLCVVADSVARPILQNRYQFNGYCSCSYCYHGGLYVRESGIRYPFLEEEPKLRSHASHMKDVEYVLRNDKPVRGVKGESAFSSTPNIDMVWGFPLDYLHNGLLGVSEQCWNTWNKEVFSPSQRKAIDELIMLIQPPRDLRRLPEKISSKGVWKATHWKCWLLFFSLPILSKFLPEHFLAHYALFVNSIYTLLKNDISVDELNKTEENLMIFVANYETLYGTGKMTFNVHLLLHAVESVRMSGPLWATSAFPFENNIHCLKETINGPKSVEQQIANKTLSKLYYKLKPRNPFLSEEASQYCQNIFNKKTVTKGALKIEDVTLFGPSLQNRFEAEKEFERCIINNCVYSSTKYLRSKKFNDTVVLLKNGKIAQITKITVKLDNQIEFDVRELMVEPFLVYDVLVLHIFKVTKNVKHLPITNLEIQSKIVALDFKDEQYVCMIPNTIEAQ